MVIHVARNATNWSRGSTWKGVAKLISKRCLQIIGNLHYFACHGAAHGYYRPGTSGRTMDHAPANVGTKGGP